MTMEEAKSILYEWQEMMVRNGVPIDTSKVQALRVAIEALSAEAVEAIHDTEWVAVRRDEYEDFLASAEAEDRLYIKIYADDEPSVKAEKLYQICCETQKREVAEWLKEYFPSAEAVQGAGRYENAMQKLREIPRYLNGIKEKQIKKIPSEAVQGWIPFTRRPMTEEEQKDYPNCTFIFDCVLPDDGDEILVSNGRFVWMDTFCNDIDGCYLDGGDDIDDGMAWMPLPKPYERR